MIAEAALPPSFRGRGAFSSQPGPGLFFESIIGKIPITKTMRASQDHRATANVANLAGWVLLVLAALVLLGWAFNLRGLQSFVPETAGIKANSAIAMLLASVAMLRRNDRALPFLSLAVFLIGALTLSEYAWDRNFGLMSFSFTIRITCSIRGGCPSTSASDICFSDHLSSR